jgi:RNA polymerase sigma factor (TIGR02999 family)
VCWKAGDSQALAELIPLVYDELRRASRRQLRRERPDHTFQSVVLVNEMYMRMLVQKPFGAENRPHFFMAASRLMRQILVDHARVTVRNRGADKISM